MKDCERCEGTGSVLYWSWDYTKFIDCPACGGYQVDVIIRDPSVIRYHDDGDPNE